MFATASLIQFCVPEPDNSGWELGASQYDCEGRRPHQNIRIEPAVTSVIPLFMSYSLKKINIAKD